MSDPFLGQLMVVPYTFAPRGWAFCNGQLLSIASNTALFSLLGTTYGGNGTTTFQLPDLRGRVPISSGQGPGLSNRALGEVSGVETVTLLSTQMPQHTHLVASSSANPTTADPTNAFLPVGSSRVYAAPGSSVGASFAPQTVQIAGGSQPHENMPPYLVMNWVIALQGIFPSRS